jgi:hypothetical protein
LKIYGLLEDFFRYRSQESNRYIFRVSPKKWNFLDFFMFFRPKNLFLKMTRIGIIWCRRGGGINCAHYQNVKTLPWSWIRETECVYWSENRKFLDFLLENDFLGSKFMSGNASLTLIQRIVVCVLKRKSKIFRFSAWKWRVHSQHIHFYYPKNNIWLIDWGYINLFKPYLKNIPREYAWLVW